MRLVVDLAVSTSYLGDLKSAKLKTLVLLLARPYETGSRSHSKYPHLISESQRSDLESSAFVYAREMDSCSWVSLCVGDCAYIAMQCKNRERGKNNT